MADLLLWIVDVVGSDKMRISNGEMRTSLDEIPQALCSISKNSMPTRIAAFASRAIATVMFPYESK
jgi:hypothetical protein